MKISNEKMLIGEMQLLGCGVFLGLAFALDRVAMLSNIGPLTFNAFRYLITTLCLVVLQPMFERMCESKSEIAEQENNSNTTLTKDERNTTYWNDLMFWGMAAGLTAFGGATFQVAGMLSVTASKTGFILGLTVVVLPLSEYFFFGGNFTIYMIVALSVSVVGMFLLCGCATQVCIGTAFGYGELVVLMAMFCWTANILISAIGTRKVDTISLTYVDFITVTVLSIVCALIFESEYFVYPYKGITDNAMLWFGE